MPIRQAEYAIEPPASAPIPLSSGGPIQIDVREVAVAAVKEILQARIPAAPLGGLLQALLVPSSNSHRLLWRRNGAGVGTEMRRGFSGLFGRFFARWYLQKYHGLRYFVPIDGPYTMVSQRLVVTRNGSTHLPDWVCAGAGRVVLGEAKGSHADLKGKMPGATAPLRKAKEQIEKANVWLLHRPSMTYELRSLKGWGVMSRWATESNGFDPLLYVLDPESAGTPLGDTEVGQVELEIARTHIGSFLDIFGFATLANKLLPSTDAGYAAFISQTLDVDPELSLTRHSSGLVRPPESVRFRHDDAADRRFVGVVLDRAGQVLPEPVSQLFQMRDRLPASQRASLSFVGFDEQTIKDALLRGRHRRESMGVAQVPDMVSGSADLPALAIDNDGFALASLDMLASVDQPPEAFV